ncbi:MAG TPA: amidohydrolase family protein [Candidatus Acidoferrum sp.]|nr:amidohydrolase family protein [Candidatus Acidoferrum sp.]
MRTASFVRIVLGFALSLLAMAFVHAATPPDASPVILIQNATVLTVTKGTIEHGSVLIKDGKIAEVGKDLKAPSGAQVIDGTGMFVTPGIIDCHSHIAVDGSVNEGSISVSSIANIAEVLDSDDISIFRDLAGGVTTANVLHGSANSIGGQTVVIKLRWGQTADKLPFEGALPGIKFALGENPKRSNFSVPGREKRYPASRMGVEETIRAAFTEARDYKNAWDAYNKKVAAGEKNLTAPRRDLRLDPLVEVLEGKRYVHSHCYREDEILMLLRVAKEFGFKVRTLQHVLEGYKVADELVAAGVGASTFSDWWAYKVEAYDAIPYNAALMTKRGVVVSINSDDAEEATHLNQEAAKTIRYGGLSHDEALKLVTINPAIQLGIDKRVGSIEVGKDADLVIYNHDPLSAYAVVQKTLIDGRVYFDRQQDIAGRPALEKEKKELLEKEKKAAKKSDDKKDEKKPGDKKPEDKKSEEKKKPEDMPKMPQADVNGGAL